MRISKALQILFALATPYVANAQSFCSSAQHSGQSEKVTSNKVGSIGGIGYELWADSGNNSATFYSDGSFSCSFQAAKDYLCRSGLSFDSTKTHQQIGHMFADFKLIKQNISNVDYSYVGIYGWTRSPLVEFYIVDNWLSQYRPGDWVGNKKHGDFTIDGAQYTVFENDRFGPSIDGDTQFKQYFSIRQQARDCGTIDITAHFNQWEKLGMQLGKMHEAKVLGEAGSNGGGTSGTADFPYAKVYIGEGNGGGAAPGGGADMGGQTAGQAGQAGQTGGFDMGGQQGGFDFGNMGGFGGNQGFDMGGWGGQQGGFDFGNMGGFGGGQGFDFGNMGGFGGGQGFDFGNMGGWGGQQGGFDFGNMGGFGGGQGFDFGNMGGWGGQQGGFDFGGFGGDMGGWGGQQQGGWDQQQQQGGWDQQQQQGGWDQQQQGGFDFGNMGGFGGGQGFDFGNMGGWGGQQGGFDFGNMGGFGGGQGFDFGNMGGWGGQQGGFDMGGFGGAQGFDMGGWGGQQGGDAGGNTAPTTPPATGGGGQSNYPKGTGFQFYTQCKNQNHWALTYDDGPTQFADDILDLLKQNDIKATFFLVGNMYIPTSSPDWARIVKRMYNEGHVVASHTFSHNDLTGMGAQQIKEDMQKLEDAVFNAVGVRPAFMRPPYGSGNGNQNVMNTLKDFGMTAACTWLVDPKDWDNGGDIQYAKQVLGQLNGQGVITLNHLQYNGATRQGILDLAKAEIELMKSKGYKAVTMEECLGMSAYK